MKFTLHIYTYTSCLPILLCPGGLCLSQYALAFFQEAMERGKAIEKGRPLLKAGKLLMRKYALIRKEAGRNMTPQTRNKFLRLCFKHLAAWKKAKGHMVFKNHAMIHLGQAVQTHGNCSFFHCYNDERFNRVCKRWAKRSHPTRFGLKMLSKAKAMRLRMPKGVLVYKKK